MKKNSEKNCHSKNDTEINGRFTEDRAIWTDELQRQCEEDYDEEEMTDKQEERISQFRTEAADKQIHTRRENCRKTMDSVLTEHGWRKKQSTDQKFSRRGKEELTQEKFFEITKCFQAQAHFTCRWC